MSYRNETASILIVDDRPEKLLALEAVLEELDQEVVRAYSGRDALRQVRQREFAVILLDVNMPGMDGFETASMIRQRRSCQDVPIIFITAFGDEMHASRGYSLGAVDYILTPVVPDVLRTKVAVFVDLFRKNQQVRRQAHWQARRAQQLQKLAAASVAIHGAGSIREMLETVTHTARDVVGSHQSITLFNGQVHPGMRVRDVEAVTSFSEKYAEWSDRPFPVNLISSTHVARSASSTRLTEEQLHQHPDWRTVQHAPIPPIRGGILTAPLTGRDGRNFGLIYLSDRLDGDFTEDDEAVLVQLAQMGSIAIENTVYSQEREANRLKEEFLATLSHELRTPLNAIMGWTQLLRMNGYKGNIERGMEVIDRNVKAQTKLVEDLLDVSRISTGKLRLNVRPIPLGPIVHAAIDAVQPTIDAKNLQLQRHLDDAGDLLVPGDADRLQQVVWNLLSNAVKFTPNGGTVEVRLEQGDDQVHLHVADSGQGIDARFLPYVFDRFRQSDSSSTRTYGGLGIGLTIVRHVVELHGGSVRADSDGVGQGSTFSISLPRQSASHRPDESPSAMESADAPPAPAAPEALRHLHILLVDDEADAREVIGEILSRYQAKVTSVESAREAMAHLSDHRPHVVLCDIAMPEEDGYALIRQIRQLPKDRGGTLPAVALTAYAREEDRVQAIRAGFQAHVAKPVEPDALVAAVGQVVSATRKDARLTSDRDGASSKVDRGVETAARTSRV